MKRARFAILFVILLAGGLVINAWEYLGEARVERKQLKDFPKQVGAWEQTGGDEQFNKETLAVLRASDYLLRNYRGADGRTVNFYVGYYASQREGATYHSPLNCLPGSGWVMSEPGKITITPKGRPSFVANKYLIQNGDHKELLVYRSTQSLIAFGCDVQMVQWSVLQRLLRARNLSRCKQPSIEPRKWPPPLQPSCPNLFQTDVKQTVSLRPRKPTTS
jgi:EpsI family protein